MVNESMYDNYIVVRTPNWTRMCRDGLSSFFCLCCKVSLFKETNAVREFVGCGGMRNIACYSNRIGDILRNERNRLYS